MAKAVTCGTKSVPIKDYIKEKIKILKELGIGLTKKDRDHIQSLQTENDVDRFARTLMDRGERD